MVRVLVSQCCPGSDIYSSCIHLVPLTLCPPPSLSLSPLRLSRSLSHFTIGAAGNLPFDIIRFWMAPMRTLSSISHAFGEDGWRDVVAGFLIFIVVESYPHPVSDNCRAEWWAAEFEMTVLHPRCNCLRFSPDL